MKLEIGQHESQAVLDLPPGTITVGGAPADGVQLAGLPPRLVTMTVEPGRLVVEGRRPFAVGQLPVRAGRKRLLLPGETVHLAPGLWLRPADPDAGPAPATLGTETAAVARELLLEIGPASSKAGKLICLTGLDLGRAFPLADAPTCIGRGDQADLRLRDRHASRRHARLSRKAIGTFVEDLGSPNGVRVNGRRLREPRLLVDGDVLELGTTLLCFRAPAREPDPAPAPAPPPPPEAPAVASPAPQAAPPPASRSGQRLDVALILVGLLLAFLGAALAVKLSRETAPGQRGPPAAPSAAGAARRSW